jgi:hypothetical protein
VICDGQSFADRAQSAEFPGAMHLFLRGQLVLRSVIASRRPLHPSA